uniref:Alternative protein PTPN5 n=1 Tax=Homo sapiens TaxID=9606 RepID=L8E916_HUMAN|nr:alternative protein PTPN5 [Homo sapiens]
MPTTSGAMVGRRRCTSPLRDPSSARSPTSGAWCGRSTRPSLS